MNNVMVDLESLSTDPDGFICAIGAVAFDANGPGAEFYGTIVAPEGNGKIDAGTVFWWLKQSHEARAAFTAADSRYDTLAQALLDFSLWMYQFGPQADRRVWGNGATFDNVMLASAYRRNNLQQPWPFWGDMCYRTIKNLHGSPSNTPTRDGTHHNALDDAKYPAAHLISMNAQIGGLI